MRPQEASRGLKGFKRPGKPKLGNRQGCEHLCLDKIMDKRTCEAGEAAGGWPWSGGRVRAEMQVNKWVGR